MVGGLKRKHSDLEEEEEDEKWDWGPAGLRSYQQALLRISLDKVQRSLGPRAPSLRRHVLIHNTLQQLQAALCLAPAPALPPEPLFLGEEDFSLSATIGSILRELETSMDETEPPQNPVAPPGPQNEVLPQPDPVFLEALSSRYLGDSGLDDFFLDIDTSAVEKEPAPAPPEPPHNLFCAPGSWFYMGGTSSSEGPNRCSGSHSLSNCISHEKEDLMYPKDSNCHSNVLSSYYGPSPLPGVGIKHTALALIQHRSGGRLLTGPLCPTDNRVKRHPVAC